ncbi:MAG: DedA family protein [Chloroflexi bacterium]|nr:MAG: DedA family protein [Chloroflexota bacterium]
MDGFVWIRISPPGLRPTSPASGEVNWAAVVDAVGYPSAGLGIMIESTGIPFPGETLLLAAGAWAAARHHSLILVILFGFVGASAGADLGYLLGYKGGRPFVERFGARLRIRPEQLARAELFFARHGDKAVLGARFVLGLRTWGSMLAGMSHMPFWRFQVFSAIGGLLWAVLIGVAGYVLGSNLPLLETIIRAVGVGGLTVLLLIALILLVAERRAIRRR